MITREQFLACVDDEFRICNHLFSKLPEGSMTYRPTPGQRSTEELLRYLSYIGVASMDVMVSGSWESFSRYVGESKSWPIEEFPARMDRELEQIVEIFNALSEEDLRTRKAALPTGDHVPLGMALVKTTLEWLVAYRMQLFLYAKAAGASDLTTSNCWRGIDWTPAPKGEEADQPSKNETKA
jgi:hypothetical protein